MSCWLGAVLGKIRNLENFEIHGTDSWWKFGVVSHQTAICSSNVNTHKLIWIGEQRSCQLILDEQFLSVSLKSVWTNRIEMKPRKLTWSYSTHYKVLKVRKGSIKPIRLATGIDVWIGVNRFSLALTNALVSFFLNPAGTTFLKYPNYSECLGYRGMTFWYQLYACVNVCMYEKGTNLYIQRFLLNLWKHSCSVVSSSSSSFFFFVSDTNTMYTWHCK